MRYTNNFCTDNREALFKMISLLLDCGYDDIVVRDEDCGLASLHWHRREYDNCSFELVDDEGKFHDDD